MVRLLNNRLSTIFVDNSILNKTQFVGLPGSSTFEPLRIVNKIIQDAKESNNELWILFQDLSKAYDRVNIKMLTKAMERLKLPLSFIQLIANLFTDRENEVFTAVGTTPFYKVLTGIDQGEVMSPFYGASIWTLSFVKFNNGILVTIYNILIRKTFIMKI